MAAPEVTPADISPTEDGSALQVTWGDGHVSIFVPLRLRQLCPCAGCVDEMTGQRTLRPERVDQSVYPTAIHYVGRYALQFMWSDGHSTGFYPFEYLRRICDCPDCAENDD